MKFLLVAVNAKYIHSNPAIYSLKACAGENAGQCVELAEYTINQRQEEIMADIYRRKPDIIGISCYIWNRRNVLDLVAELPKILPGTKLWLGGPEVSYDAEVIMKEYPQLSGIMVGEGEETFKELLDFYREQEKSGNENISLERIPGLCLPGGFTPARELTDLTKLPFLYQDLDSFANRIIYYESGRGCPYRCSYCLSSIDKKVRFRNIHIVKRELQFFLDNKVPQVKFVDRTFNCDHDHAMAIWEYILEHDNGVTNFHFEISADILREDEIAILNRMRPGLVQLEIGVQSVNPRTLQEICRVMDVDKLERVVSAIGAGHNIHQHLDLIAGLPYEDYESFGRSFNRVYAMEPNQLQLGFLKVLKGSAMHEKAGQYGIRYLDEPPYEVLCSKWLSYEDILRLKGVEEMVEIYYNSNQFSHTLRYLQKAFPDPFAMFEALARFYEEEGYLANSPARVYRYQVLLKFAEKYDGASINIYRELLTYDLYLREKVKSRPEFAPGLAGHNLPDYDQPDHDLLDHDLWDQGIKKFIREFYAREEKERRYLPDYKEFDRKQLSKMTHLEPFRYPVWDRRRMDELAKRTGFVESTDSMEPTDSMGPEAYILFDYRNRDPLTREAASFVISAC